MKLNKIWEGKLPSYWDVTAWTALVGNHLMVCYRDVNTRKRVVEVFDLVSGESSIEESVYNGILGSHENHVYLAHITDARAHLQLKRVSNYDIITRSVQWTSNESFLVEKFKVPTITPQNAAHYPLGNKVINLRTGELADGSQRSWQQQKWQLGSGLHLEQKGATLSCVNEREIIWTLADIYGNRYQGTREDALYFLLPDDQLLLINKSTGDEQERLHLDGVKKVSDRLGGSFDFKNDLSFDTCTIADSLIHEDLVVWVTEDNRLVVKNIRTGQVSIVKFDGDEYDLCLSAMNCDYILLYGIKDADYGSLLIVRLEDLIYGSSGDGSR